MTDGSARRIEPVRALEGRLEAPPSKSVTQRALVAASQARGRSVLRRALLADDSRLLIDALTAVGIPIQVREEAGAIRIEVDGAGGVESGPQHLYLGNAGTAMRFLCARLAAERTPFLLDGDARMRQRPIEDLLAALRQLGAFAESVEATGCPPVRVGGTGMRGGACTLSGARSSQFVSALLLSAPSADDGVQIDVSGDRVSRPYVDLTVQVLGCFGVSVSSRAGEPAGQASEAARSPSDGAARFEVAPGQMCRPADLELEGDYSSASYFFTAAAVVPGRVEVAHLDPGSAQGDARFLALLQEMGCTVARTDRTIVVEGPESLRGITADLRDMPDIAPALAVTALFAKGETRITSVPHLRLKESDRIDALCSAIARLGGEAEPRADGLVIRPRPLAGAAIDPLNDHRLAMAFAVAGLRVKGVSILTPDCVAKSYPGFWTDFESLRRT